MEVLNLVTTGDASFFRQQVETLERKGVESTTLAVGSKRDVPHGGERSPVEYVRLYLQALSEATDHYDLVHVHYGLIAPLALAQPRRPVVLTLWGSDLMNEDWVARLSRTSARYCDAVILPSPAMSRHLAVPHEVIPFGVDLDRFRPIPRGRARSRLGWDTDAPVVLFPNSKERDVKDFPRAERIVDSLSVGAELRWITGLPHEAVPYYMNAADAVLVTSRREAGPMVVKEAAACNAPVFSTDVGFASEVLEPVSNSGVCSSDDEFVEALEGVLRSGARSNGRETLSGAGLDETGDRIVRLYRSVLASSPRADVAP